MVRGHPADFLPKMGLELMHSWFPIWWLNHYTRLALHNDNMLIKKKHAEVLLLTSQESWRPRHSGEGGRERGRTNHTSQLILLSFSTCRARMSALEIPLYLQRRSMQLNTPEDQESSLVEIFYRKRGSFNIYPLPVDES